MAQTRFGILMIQRGARGETATRMLAVFFENQEQAETAARTLASLPGAEFRVVAVDQAQQGGA